MCWVAVSLVLLWSSVAVVTPVSVSCKDENDRDVDWYILYKAPKINRLTGLEYIYIDPSGKRVMSPSTDPHYKLINHRSGVLANTLRPMFTVPKRSFSFLSYSDQPPNGSCARNFGHSKGVVLGDSGTQTALWLTHSTPRFPFSKNQSQFWPDSGIQNAQTFMCVSLHFSELQTVGTHLQSIRAFVFDYNSDGFPKALKDAPKNLAPNPTGDVQKLTTRGKKELRVLAKQKGKTAADGDLYVQLARRFGRGLAAKTWGRQCHKHQSYSQRGVTVVNVEYLRTDLGEWSWGNDHSKWAVTTTDGDTPCIYCISDMNRSSSQYQRFGGALCIQDKSVHSYFKRFVSTTRKRSHPDYPDSGCTECPE